MLILDEYAKIRSNSSEYIDHKNKEFIEKNKKFLLKYGFLVDNTLFLEKYRQLSNIIKKEYKVDFDDVSFQQRQFTKKRWSRAKERNFYMTLKILAENGPMSIQEIYKLDSFYKNEKKTLKYKTYYRLFNGVKNDNATGLVEKKIVKKNNIDNEDSEITYELTLFGIFLAIEFFFNEKETLFSINTSEESLEKSIEILDLIAKNYQGYLSMIFKKWNVLKSIKNSFVLIKTIMTPEYKMRNWMRTLSDMHRFATIFNSDEKQITGMFYYDFAYSYAAELTQKQKKQLGTEIIEHIEKILEIAIHKTLEEKADIEFHKWWIEGAPVEKVDLIHGEIERLENEMLSFKI